MDIFQETSKRLFLENPDIFAFSWTQYTPYSTFEFQINLDRIQICGGRNENRNELHTKIKNFISLFGTDFLLDKFGDNARIIVQKDGIKIIDFDEHD
jgi:hypothetical protein